VASILDATVHQIQAVGFSGLRVADVAVRAGVGTSSIYHFFGSRAALIAASTADRFDRSVGTDTGGLLPLLGDSEASLEELAQLFGLLEPTEGTGRSEYRAALMRAASGVVTSSSGSERRADRIIALGAAARNPVLLSRLGASLGVRISLTEQSFTRAAARGLLPDGLSPRALANYSLAHQMGLVPNGLMHQPVSADEWTIVSLHALSAILGDPEVRADFSRASELMDLLDHLRWDPARGYGDDLEGKVCRAAVMRYRSGGPAAVIVSDVRNDAGVSAGWFHRHFNDRDGLLDAIRIGLVREHLRSDVLAIRAITDWARTPSEWVAAILIAANTALGGGRDAVRWDTVETLAASFGRPALRRAIGELESTAVSGFETALATAKAKGLVAEQVPDRAAARFLLGYHFGLLIGEVSELAPTPAEWRSVIEPLLWSLTPQGWDRASEGLPDLRQDAPSRPRAGGT